MTRFTRLGRGYTILTPILYSANCICIQSEPLLLHLPQIIPSNRLACISSLEMFITAHRTLHENGKTAFNVDHLKPILDNIATYCHNLRSLCLIFLVADWGHQISDGPALPLVDAFYRSMPLRKMRVDLPRRAYWKRCNSWCEDGHPHEAAGQGGTVPKIEVEAVR